MPLVLLVDENSASASEVLAGAFQDNDRAIIVGSKHLVKDWFQSVLSLPFGSGLTLTAARYYTPSGRSIQRDYADVGLYDYFNHRNGPVEIERSVYAAKTITNRVVYGGDGITPDEISGDDTLTPAQISLLDPLFFFAREFANGRIRKAEDMAPSTNEQIRQPDRIRRADGFRRDGPSFYRICRQRKIRGRSRQNRWHGSRLS